MATAEHCLYCFEALAAHLQDFKPMTLKEVQQSFDEYCREGAVEDGEDGSTGSASKLTQLKKRLPAFSRLTEGSGSASSSSGISSASTMSLDNDTPQTSTESLSTVSVVTESPLFVTWNTISPRSGNTMLRGCIGTFEAQDLDEGLSSYALTSAIHDMRFDPISKRELPSLEVAVTLLTDFEDAEDPMDWELGTHGLRISFTDRGRRYGSTYLPDVATEQGWTKEETLVSLMRKAGWVGKKNKWDEVDLHVVRYQGKKECLEYAEYKLWRDWVNAKSNA